MGWVWGLGFRVWGLGAWGEVWHFEAQDVTTMAPVGEVLGEIEVVIKHRHGPEKTARVL